MNLGESLKSAVRNVFANKMRALLTMLGIVIGIAAVIMITSIGAGSTAQITEQLSALGVGQLIVAVDNSGTVRDSERLTMRDVELLKEFDELKYVSPSYSSWGTSIKLLNPTETSNARIAGATEDYRMMNNPTILYGRYITDNDVDNSSKVIVINDTTAEKVFGYSDQRVLGQRVTIRTWRTSEKYTVVGITENTNASMEAMFGSSNSSEQMVMPITALLKLYNDKYLSSISVVARDENNIEAISAEIVEMLNRTHRTSDKYIVENIMQQMESINSILGLITTFISAVAGISLVVGGIGVMNIMLVTVTERTREIGIRKSIGARNKDIRLQFIVEAIIITGIGGILGLIIGAVGGNLIGNLMGIQAIPSMDAILLAVGMSSAIGLIFGVYPANKAAKLNPIEALRYE